MAASTEIVDEISRFPKGLWMVTRSSVSSSSLPAQIKDWVLLDLNSTPTLELHTSGGVMGPDTARITLASDERNTRRMQVYECPDFLALAILPEVECRRDCNPQCSKGCYILTERHLSPQELFSRRALQEYVEAWGNPAVARQVAGAIGEILHPKSR